VGTGFSYSTNSTEMTSFADSTTAAATYQFLLNFFAEYKEFKSNAFMVLGESYAGYEKP
jgi:carboxypeptidase C (cathepsin A)